MLSGVEWNNSGVVLAAGGGRGFLHTAGSGGSVLVFLPWMMKAVVGSESRIIRKLIVHEAK
jgi:hypothetical protein